MKTSTRILKKLKSLPHWLRILLHSLAIALPFYFSALLSMQVQDVAHLGGNQALALHAFVIVALTTAIVFAIRLFQAMQENLELANRKRTEALMQAYNETDKFVTENLIVLRRGVKALGGRGHKSLLDTIMPSESSIKSLVTKLLAILETLFGNEGSLENRIEFEVTFMTKSFKDGRITIAAWANRDGRAPRSMLSRATDPNIYDSTVTAQVYREPRPNCHIVEDTNVAKYDYQELYPGQKSRIRSSIIYPVLSDANELLGTLVVHCNRAYFFLEEDKQYWRDLLEIFTKRIALEKARLDMIFGPLRGKNIPFSDPAPF